MKSIKYYEKKLEKERRKLDRLIDATIDQPIALNQDILTQSRIVDELVARLQRRGEGVQGRGHTHRKSSAPKGP